MTKTIPLTVLLLLVSKLAPAQEMATWETSYRYSEASGNIVCTLRAPNTSVGFMFFRSGSFEQQTLVVGGTKDPSSTVYVKIGEQRFSGNENDMVYWSQQSLISELLSSKEMWAEWTAWPGKHKEAHFLMGNFVDKYEECAAKLRSAN